MHSREILEDITERVARARQSFHPKHWKIRRPGWLRPDDDLYEIFQKQDLLARKGRVVWAVVVQANQVLFGNPNPDGTGAPGTVVFMADIRPGTLEYLRKLRQPLVKLRAVPANVPADQKRYGEMLARRAPHPEMGTPSVHASLIKGGQELSSYPAECVVSLERRTVPGERPEAIEQEMRTLLNRVKADDPDYKRGIPTLVGLEG